MAKRQAEYTLSDVIRLDPKWLRKKQERLDPTSSGMYDDNRAFLANMMSSGRTGIAEYYFFDVFPEYDISQYQIPDINKALYEYEETNRPAVVKRLDNPNLAMIREGFKRGDLKANSDQLRYKLDRARSAVSDHEYNARAYESDAANSFRRAHEYEYKRIESVEKLQEAELSAENIEAEIAEFTGGLDKRKMAVLRAIPKNFRIVKVTATRFYVVNISPIILTEINSASGHNRTMNLGHHIFKFDYDMAYHGIQYFADNISVRVNHPHVSGYVCWGNLQTLADNKLKAKDYVGWWALFEALLANYNAGSPFMQWEQYRKNKSRQYKPISNTTYPDAMQEIYRNSNSAQFIEAYEKSMIPRSRKRLPQQETNTTEEL